MPSRPRDLLGTVLITAFACALRIVIADRLRLMPAWDGTLYHRGAQAIAHGYGYSTFMYVTRTSDTAPTAYYPVGYPAALGIAYALFGISYTVQRMFGALVSGLSVAFVHRLAVRVTTPWTARIAALAVAVMPGQVLFASATMTEPLWGLLLVAAVYVVARRDGPLHVVEIIAAGIILGAATYVRPQAVLLAPVIGWVRPGIRWGGLRGRALNGVLVTATCIACVAPWSIRNCERLDGCAFVSTNGGSNLVIGALPRATGTFDFLGPRDGCVGVVGEVARDRCWRATALHHIREAPLRWLALGLRKLSHTLAYESFPVGYMHESQVSTGVMPAWRALRIDTNDDERFYRQQLLSRPWLVLLTLALLGGIVALHRRSAPLPVIASAATVGTVLAMHFLFFGGDRYHLPLVPLLAVIAAGLRPRPAQPSAATQAFDRGKDVVEK